MPIGLQARSRACGLPPSRINAQKSDAMPTLIEQRQTAEAPALAALRQRHAGARILVAEDNLVNQEIVCACLEEAGMRVDVVGNGQEAVDRVSTAYQFVLMDLWMPEMDGLEATRKIRKMPGMADLPIVALTACTGREDRAACAAAGMSGFLAKPIETRLLYQVLLAWLDRWALTALRC